MAESMPELSDVHDIAKGLRRLWEGVLLTSIDTSETAGSCLYAAILLSMSVSKFAGANARVCGGDGGADGLMDPQGVLRGHYWVEGETLSGEHFVADVTADQFGYGKVVVLPMITARAIYYPGDQAIVDLHVREELQRCVQAAELTG